MTKCAGHDGSAGEDKTTTGGETKAHGDSVRQDCETAEGTTNTMKPLFPQVDNPQPNGAGYHGFKGNKTTAGGETKAHGNLVRENYETAEGMTNAMKMLFPQVDNPQPNGTQPRRRLVEENLQTPGQPCVPYVKLYEGFRAGSEKSVLIRAFVKSWDKVMAGEV